MKILIAAALLGTVAAGGIACAQVTPAPFAAGKVARADSNRDGKISRAEFITRAEARFARLDVNKDGALTAGEARTGRGRGGRWGRPGAIGQDGSPPSVGMRGPGRGGGVLRQDSNGDGRVTRAEFDAQTTTMFARMDPNADGTVDKTEMAALLGGGRMAARADSDGNGMLTRAEFVAQASQRFTRMDTNSDAIIDTTELQVRSMGRGRDRRPVSPTPPAPSGA